MNSSLLLGLHAHTWIHAGSGEKDGVVDLPIQREAHTGWPVIFGSSLKGAMRSQVSRTKGEQAELSLVTLFGPDSLHTGATSDKIHAGALLVSDARLLWLPVRSLTSHTRYVTCPALLRRLLADWQRAGQPQSLVVPKVGELEALIAGDQTGRIYLEEYAFTARAESMLTPWGTLLARFCDLEAEQVLNQLTLIHDDQFAHLCQAAIPVHPHISLKADKSVRDGALWYEEALPPDTLFYTLLLLTDARDGSGLGAATLKNQIEQALLGDAPYLQVGGNESTGMGWLQLTPLQQEEA
ncbi:type III-B CRISPR module RAMP protein Cmr4 [Aeromonas hydrophila]|uniref:type III-B CRISPR module RAMP protein Cmr4 n=1 Tax=Aeromonas hydrophila TaxID=644 RepID=UPI001B39E2EB|nr:type III-B CRISPR module RAMP protein Cmr4 [Aeromonas hydrophila]MBQ4676652.1 type III-B CRISPR module RAMP protein Cmr4 [Aeromonas hydrophila]MBW3813257.1 type III-B CRISPR module RAMP protein Cmr4 [Aeromonas hydrophila]MCF7678489.1 type III-B CRISPR module RAMP protein Cmr4 [Aeromonas hydrophila]MCF7691537.1 type III-B CRISPR module RAMP protein Cmr4 [Aeromonas hydrophila]MCF7772337.1 type III-B CRISPR module RAMP protein Cmr4 [Aeromonas hydrophila]